jgi:uncharacterized protein (UPF0548 family)
VLPPGYHHLERRARLGTGRTVFERGEEAFIVSIGEAGDVWFTVRAFTRPGTLLARISGPFGRLAQRLAARRYISAMRRLSAG